MLKRNLFILKYWVGWIIFFEITRLGFLISNLSQVQSVGYRSSFLSLFYGLRMDMSAAAYFTLPVALMALLSVFIKALRNIFFYKLYTACAIFFALVIFFVDIELFKAWGYRLDAGVLKYLYNPKEVWASVYNLPLFFIFLLFIVVYSVFFLLSKKLLLNNSASLQYNQKKILSFFAVIILIGLFIIPIRGGLQQVPLNQSSVYFSQNNFINMAAINAPWNLFYTLNHNTNDGINPFIITTKQKAVSTVDSLFQSQKHTISYISSQKNPSPNIILIAWESFTSKVIGLKKEGKQIVPGFENLIKEGIYFSNIYATGDRTDKGIVGILSGYPSQPLGSIVKIPVKAARLPMLPQIFKKSGYNTSFHYGGELEFANMKAYLLQGGFNRFISISDFDKKDQNSKWGAHDGVVMQKLFQDISTTAQPFFSTWLTLSSHEPYEIPAAPILPGADDESQFLSSLHYTDSIVYEFLQQCKKQSWWNNTVVIIAADHGHRLLSTGKKTDDFTIPLLFLGGALSTTGIVYNNVGSQIDIAATLLAQVGIDAAAFKWSKNLLDSTTKQWSYFSFNNGFGYIQAGKKLVFDNIGKIPIQQDGNITNQDIYNGKALQQAAFQDYLDK